MAFTQEDLDTLDQAILERQGARSIAFSDQVVTFDSIEDMLKLRAVIARQVNGTSRTRYAQTSKGC